ncbi:MAG: DNA polymerase III subunit [Clostridia bacterium]
MFKDIIGHNENIQMLKESVQKDSVIHAYLFDGPDGIGKQLVAKEFAKEILETENLETCPDYIYIDKLENKKDILVEQIRESIVNNVYSKPVASNKKVYIINNAQDMNNVAQNSLLKTLEEPPKYIVLILVANQVDKFLPTIISRVKRIKFKKLTNKDIDKYIVENNIIVSENIKEYIDGSLGKLKLMENLSAYEEIEKFVDKLKTENIVYLLEISKIVDFRNNNYMNYLQFVLYNNYKKCKNIKLLECINTIEIAKQRLKTNGNYDIVSDIAIITMCNCLRR